MQTIEALIQSHKQHALVQIILPDTLERYQSVIVGYDAFTSEILLGGLYPSPQFNFYDRLAKNEFWIQCQYGNQYLTIVAKTLEILARGELISARINSSKITSNRRWSPRVEFRPHQGPQVELLSSYGPIEKAWIKNISYHGALIECYGKDIRDTIPLNANNQRQGLSVRMEFNSHFKLESRVLVKQKFFKRSPGCHTGIRVTFTSLAEVERLQILDFVDQSSGTAQVA